MLTSTKSLLLELRNRIRLLDIKGVIRLTYEELLTLSDSENLIVKEKELSGYGGRIYKNRIAINRSLPTQVEKSCVLAEELGHHYTTTGDILDQSNTMNRKQEYRARLYGYNLKIGLTGLIRAYESGCRNFYEMDEYLDATEKYLKEAIDCYKAKYGLYVSIDNYIIYFEPFVVIKIISTE